MQSTSSILLHLFLCSVAVMAQPEVTCDECLIFTSRKQVFFSNLFDCHTANNFGLMYSRKRISQNSFPNFIYIIPKSFMVFCQELRNPKRNYENQIWTYRLPRTSSWKSNEHNTLELNSGTFASHASILPLNHQSWYIWIPQSCPCQDHSWGNKSAKQVKVTSKNDSPWWFWMELIIFWMELIFLFWN